MKTDLKRLIIGSDHAGMQVKESIKEGSRVWGYEVMDVGTHAPASVDYPEIAKRACELFLKEGTYAFGILICGTGIGISMAANKIKGIRCAAVYTRFMAARAKKHNHANFIAFGSDVILEEGTSYLDLLQAYIDAKESPHERHIRRLRKVMHIEADAGVESTET